MYATPQEAIVHMTNRLAIYRSRRSGAWLSHPYPGPYPQAHSKDYPTIKTTCTCGHLGPLHAKQTTEARPRTNIETLLGKPAPRLRYRGRCKGIHPQTGMRCPCGWFLEDLPIRLTDDERKARYAWRPKGEPLPPRPKPIAHVRGEMKAENEIYFYANAFIVGDWA